jgi:hypothetical protein
MRPDIRPGYHIGYWSHLIIHGFPFDSVVFLLNRFCYTL